MTERSNAEDRVRADLVALAANPARLTFRLALPSGMEAVLRPLAPVDVQALGQFFDSLGSSTREFYSVRGDGLEMARQSCDAIARYDKLRFVLETPDARVVGLFEFSRDLVAHDVARYETHGRPLTRGLDFRYGLCLSDDFQGKGNASAVQPLVNEAARHFGARRLILWGGVHGTNIRAMQFYERVGFQEVGRFSDAENASCVDMIAELTAS